MGLGIGVFGVPYELWITGSSLKTACDMVQVVQKQCQMQARAKLEIHVCHICLRYIVTKRTTSINLTYKTNIDMQIKITMLNLPSPIDQL